MSSKTKEYLHIILKKMCDIIKVDIDKIDFSDDNNPYYDKYSWKEEQEQEFINWLSDYLYNNAKARKAIMKFPTLFHTKKKCYEWAGWFTFTHGWRSNEKEQIESNYKF